MRVGSRPMKVPSGIPTGPPSTLAPGVAIEALARAARALPVRVMALFVVLAEPPAGV